MKNRKFIGKDSFEATGWDIQTYTSKLFEDNKVCFWAEFSYTNGYHTMNLDLDQAKAVADELTKFINEATKKEEEFKEKQKKAKK